MAERKLDIFEVLAQADLKSRSFYQSLSEEQQKDLQPYVVTRWLSGTSSARQVVFINELVNPFLFVNHIQKNHKHLLWQLMTIATSGKKQRYVWNKLLSRATSSKPTSAKLIASYYGYSMKEANEALLCLSGDDVLDLAVDVGLQPDDLAKIRKEYKGEKLKEDGIKPTRRSKKPTPDLLDF